MTETPCIMLVEDDRAIAGALTTRLESEGYRVVPVPDGSSAVLAGHRLSPDLLLLDVHLPLRSGFEVATVLRERFEQVPVVFITASKDLKTREASERFSNSWFIEKPFTTPFLINTIRIALDQADAIAG